MKIIFILPSLSAGGAEGFIVSLAVALARKGCGCHVFVLGGIRDARGIELCNQLAEANVGFTGDTKRSTRSLVNFVEFRRVLGLFAPDVIYVNLRAAEWFCMVGGFGGTSEGPVFTRRLANRVPQNTFSEKLGFRIRSRFYKFSVACSQAVEESAMSCLGKSARRRNREFAVIRNGIVFPHGPPSDDERRDARAKISIADDELFLLNVGSFGLTKTQIDGSGVRFGQKGQDIAIKAFAKAFAGEDKTVLGFLGDGPSISDAKALASELGIAGNVRFFGKASNPWSHLSAADAFLFPSRFEGMPNALVEASGMGLPAIVSDIPEIRAIEPSRGWRFCPVDDEMAFANAIRELRANLRSAKADALATSWEFRDGFSMERCVDEHLRFFRTAMERSG